MMSRVVHIAIVTAFTVAGIALAAHDRTTRGLDYDERSTLDFVAAAAPDVFADYALLRNPLDPGRIDQHAIAMEDFRTYPAYYVIARSVYAPDEPHTNIARLRWISILAAGLTVPAAYLLGLRFGPMTAWLTALFTMLHPTFQFHAQNIRFYALLVFTSTAALAWFVWVMPVLPRLVAEPGRKVLGWMGVVASGAIVGLLLTVHLGAVFPLAAAAVIAGYHLRFSRVMAGLLLAAAVFATVPLANVGFFFYVRAIADKSVEQIVMSAGPVSGLAAVAFNVGFGYCLLAAVFLLACGRLLPDGPPAHDARPIRWGLLVGAVGIVCAFALKAQIVRADYTLGFFPVVLLAAAMAIRGLADRSSVPRISGGVITALALLLVLPSYVSTLAIDGDRVDYLTAIRLIRSDAGGRPAVVFADSPSTLAYLDTAPGDRPEYRHVKEAGTHDIPADRRVYWLMREVKGLRTNRFAGFEKINGRLIQIIGKDRLDLRVCRLYLFRAVEE